ncbi:AvrE-family type 3 secretion system effector [Hahella ganghwensis]|uniref:AvrE-family type 3 secretion system effector n=1 Tax=Hahella ganghwensis TaxID=286420 RepID=UPI00035D554C|nr:AvrE-family type 3 secretion system effector [Hahella ganghwensis]
MTDYIRYLTNSDGQLIKLDWAGYPNNVTLQIYDPVSGNFVENTAASNSLRQYLDAVFESINQTVRSHKDIQSIHVEFDGSTPKFSAQVVKHYTGAQLYKNQEILYFNSEGIKSRSDFRHTSTHMDVAADGTVVSFSEGENKFRFVSSSGVASTVRTSVKVRDVKIINGKGDSKLVWALTKYGTLEVTSFDAEGNLDLVASNAMFDFFNGSNANYIAIHTDNTGRAYALDKQGYLHVYSDNEQLTAMYKSAEPVVDLSGLSKLSHGRLTIDAEGRLTFVGMKKNGALTGSPLTANVHQQIKTNNLDLVSGKVSVSSDHHYLLKDGALFQKLGDQDWKASDYSGLKNLQRNEDGTAIALEGSDSVLKLSSDGTVTRHRFDVPGAYLLDAQSKDGITFGLDSDGLLHFAGSINGTLDVSGIPNMEGTLSSFVIKAGTVFASTSEGQLVRFNVPTVSGDQSVTAGSVIAGTGASGADARNVVQVQIGPGGDIVTLNDQGSTANGIGGSNGYQYQTFNPADQTFNPIVDASFRGFNKATGFDDYGLIVTDAGRRFTLYDGVVYMHDQRSDSWLATNAQDIKKLKLGADGHLYALKHDGYLAQLNDLGFTATTGVQAPARGDQNVYVAKAVFLGEGVNEFAVSASGSVYFLDQDGGYQKLDITDEKYGTISRLAEESASAPHVSLNINDLPVGIEAAVHTAREESGRVWLMDNRQRLFYSDSVNGPYEWVDVGRIENADRFGLLEGGRVYVATTDGKKKFFDQYSWMEVAAADPVDASPEVQGTSSTKSMAVAGDGTLWAISDEGKLFRKGTESGAAWQEVTPDSHRNIAPFQKLKTLADGTVVGKTSEGKLYRQGPDGNWAQAYQDSTTTDFDALFDQLSFSRFKHEYQVLFFGASDPASSLFGYKLKKHHLTSALSQDIPAVGTQSNRLKKFNDWSAAHFRYHSTNARAGHHDDISKAKQEIKDSFRVLLSRPPEFLENQIDSGIKSRLDDFKAKMDGEHADAIKRIRKLINLDLDDGNLNPDWSKTSAFQEFKALFHPNRVNSNSNAIYRLYEYRKSAFGSGDGVAAQLKSLLDAGVYMPPDGGDASALVGKLVHDTALLHQLREATLLAQISVNNGTAVEEAKATLDVAVEAAETSQKESAIGKLGKGNFNSLDRADRYFKTIDYLLGGLKNDKSKLTRALTRQGAVKDHVSHRYVNLINTMKDGESLSLDAGWKLGAELGAGWSHAPGFTPVAPFQFGFAGIAGKVAAGGGNKYKLVVKKTAEGVDIDIAFDRAFDITPSISGSVGAGAGLSAVGAGTLSASAGASATVGYKFAATQTEKVTLTIAKDDKGTIQSTLDKLLKGTIDPYELLEISKKGAAYSGSNQTHSVDFSGTVGAGLSLGANSPLNTGDRQVRNAATLTIGALGLDANIFKAKKEARLTYKDGQDLSREYIDKRGFFNSIGLSFTPVSLTAGSALRDFDADPAFDHDGNSATPTQNLANARGDLGRSVTGVSYKFSKSWDRMESNFLPKDGYKLEAGESGVNKVTWSIDIQKTSRLFDQPKVKALLEALPEVKEQLIKLASFTTPKNRANIKSVLSQLAGRPGVDAAELAELNKYSDFLAKGDKKKFRKALAKFAKQHPELSGDTGALKNSLGTSFWSKTQQPISIALELTPEALVRLNSYTSNEGDYQLFVNRIAQDANNFRISSFSVTEKHAYSTTGGLDALILKFSSDASLALEKKTADIKVFYSDGAMVADLENKVRQLARADKSSVSDSDVRDGIDRKVNALVEIINTRFGHLDAPEKTAAISAIQSLVNQPFDTTDVTGTIKKLRSLAAVTDPSIPENKPTFTYSGDRLVENQSGFNQQLRNFKGLVRSGGEAMLTGLSNPAEEIALGQTVQSAQKAARQVILDSYRADMDINQVVGAQSDADSAFKEAIRTNSGTGDLNFADRIRMMFEVNGQGQLAGSPADFAQLRQELTSMVSEEAVSQLQAIYDTHQSNLEELVTSDLWTLYTDGSTDLVEMHHGQIYYSVQDSEGNITKIVKVPHAVIKRIVQQEGMAILDAMANGHTGNFFLQEGSLDDNALNVLASQPLVARPGEGFSSSEHLANPRQSGYQGNHVVGILEAIDEGRLYISDLNAAQEYVLAEFFPSQNGESFDSSRVYSLLLDGESFNEFRHVIDLATRGDVSIELDTNDRGATLVEKVIDWQTMTRETSAATSDIVNAARNRGTDVRLRQAPQSLYLGAGDNAPNGRCVGIGLGYLHMLSQGTGSQASEAFLDALVTSAAISDTMHQDRDISTTEFAQNTDFRLLIDELHQTGGQNALTQRGQQTLEAVFADLSASSGNKYLVLNTSNHSLQLARKSVNGTDRFFFYDPNIGRLEAATAEGLRSTVQAVLDQAGGSLGQSLAEYYELDTAGFNVSEFHPAESDQLQAFRHLNDLVMTDGFQTESSRMASLGLVTLDGITVSAGALYQAGVLVDGGRISKETLTELINGENGGLSRLKFDRNGIEAFYTGTATEGEKAAVAKLLKKRLLQESGDIESVFLRGNEGFVAEGAVGYGDLAKDIAEVINSSVSDSLVVSSTFKGQLELALENHKQGQLAQTLQSRFGLSDADAQSVSELASLSERLTDFSAEDFAALREKYPHLNDRQRLEIAATDSLQKAVRGLDGANDVINMAEWTSTDAQRYLIDKGILAYGRAEPLNPQAIGKIIKNGTHTDVLRMVTAMMKLDPGLSEGIYRTLQGQEDAGLRQLGQSLESNHRPSKLSKAVDSGGNVFNTFETLNAIRAVISDWSKMSVRDKALTLTELVGGVALPTVVSKGISQAFKAAGSALGTVGKTVKAGVLDLVLAPVSLTAIGLQWKDFWNNGGDTGSYEYKSLVANTVITSVSLAASVALTGVSIAASVSAAVAGTTVAAAAAAGSTLAAIASAAGPIGIAIGAAAFLVNGIVQGALQIAEYDDYFDNVGDKVHQFFAAWIGIETDGMKKAKARKQGEEAANAMETSLLENWNETKQFLSDLFAKNGHKYLNVSNRTYNVEYGIIQSSGEWKHLLQQNTHYTDLERISSDLIADGSTVWAELGARPSETILGDSQRKNLFNLDDTTELNRVTGGDKQDAFNLTAGAQVNGVDGGAGTDTLIWDASGKKVDINTAVSQAAIIDCQYAWDLGREVDLGQSMSITSIENISVVNAKHDSVIRGGDEDNLLDVSVAGNGYADVYGGAGANVYVLNQGIKAHSVSDDTFLWKAGSDAQIYLEQGDGTQVAFIELPYHYDKVSVNKYGPRLEISGPDGGEVRIYEVSNNKILQFKDKSGSVFSLNLPSEYDAAGNRLYPMSMDRISKSFVFSEHTGSSGAEPEYLYGDQAVSNYRFREGSGHFVIEPRTQRIMTISLDVAATDIRYRYAGTSLILEHVKDGKNIKLELTHYQTQKHQMQVYANSSGDENAVPMFLNLPESGSGDIGLEHVAQGAASTNEATDALLSVQRVSDGDAVNLQGSANNRRYVVKASEASSLSINVSNVAYLRVGDDLLVYDGNTVNAENGLQSLVHLRVERYFAEGNSSDLTINGGLVSAAGINSGLTGHMGTDGNDRFFANGSLSRAGGNGEDLYEVDMSGNKTYVIDNYARDGKYDKLRFYGVPDVKNLILTSEGSDVILGYGNSRVVLKNYNQDAESRHLTVETYHGSDVSFEYTLPAVISDSVYYYELDNEEYQRVKLFNSDKPHLIDIPPGTHQKAYIEISDNINTYAKEVLGNDLKLTSADGSEQIYLKNYYAWPKAISGFVWGGDGTPRNPGEYHHDTVLPEGNYLYDSLLEVGVEPELVVRYANADVTASEARQIVAHRNNDFLAEASRNQYGAQSFPEAYYGAYDKFAVHTTVNKRRWESPYILDQMDSSSARGFRVQIKQDGKFSVDIRSNRYSYSVELASTPNTQWAYPDELSGELLIGVEPYDGNVRIWHDKYGLIAYANSISEFREAYRDGRNAANPRELYESSGTLYLGDADALMSNGMDFTEGFQILEDDFSAEVAKKRLIVEGIPGLTPELIDQLVDAQGMTSANDIGNAIAYMNRGLLDPVLIKRFNDVLRSSEGSKAREHIQTNNLDTAYVNLLREQGADADFLLAVIGSGLDIFTAQQYLAAGVNHSNVETVKGLINETAVSNSAEVVKKAMIITGYHEHAAEELAAVMAAQVLSQHSRIETFFRMGIKDGALIRKYIEADVSASELINGNRTHEQYRNGNRSDLISVSVSQDLTTTSSSTRYFVRYDFIDDDSKIRKGDLLETEAARELAGTGAIGSEYLGASSTWSGKSNPINLVDGFTQNRESTAWATSEESVTLNGNTWIEFSLTEKIAVTGFNLISQGGNGSTMTFKVQAQNKLGQWIDVAPSFGWAPGSGEATRHVDINNQGLPFSKYRLVGLAGTYADSLWLKEVTFDTQALTNGIGSHEEPSGETPITEPATPVVLPEILDITEDDDAIRLTTGQQRDIDALDGHDLIVDFDGTPADAEETFHGGNGDDRILSGIGRDLLYGDAGDDQLFGGGGNDLLNGGEGDDHLEGGTGSDLLQGGKGSDALIDYQFEPGNLYGNDLQGGEGDDVVRGAGRLDGGAGSDYLLGSDQDDKLYANASGVDLDTESNFLSGFAGNDQLTGSNSQDMLDGGTGDDLMQGGGGDDVYVIGVGEGHDRIEESGGNDQIRFVGDTLSQVNIWFSRDGQDLLLQIGSSASVAGSEAVSSQRIVNYFAGDAYKVERLLLKDYELGRTSVEQLVSYMSGKQRFDFSAVAGATGRSIAQEINRLWGAPEANATSADVVSGERIDIINASFEDKVLSQDYALDRDVPGWTISGYNTASFKDENNNATHSGASDGSNLIQVDDSGSISQILSETFDASADYQMKVDLATWKYGYASDMSIRLWAGSSIVGEVTMTASELQQNLGYGQWKTLTMDIDGSMSEAADGGDLRVELSSNPEGGGYSNKFFADNVRLAKLTGAMATFDSGAEADGGSHQAIYRLEPALVTPS